MIKFKKPEFWDKNYKSFFSLIFFPFSLITLLIIFFKKIFSNNINFKIPIICVGNIYIGGTGKTPTSILIAKEIANLGFKPVILRKYYEDHADEYDEIRNNFDNLIISADRRLGVREAEKKNYSAVILDDGLQEYRIKKNLSIVCFNSNQLIGNGLVLPAGPLRESLNIIKDVSIVLINGEKSESFENKLFKINSDIEIYYSKYKPININKFKNDKYLALAGIANPQNFFKLLEKNNVAVKKKIAVPDHYKFTKKEIEKIIDNADKENLKVIMTEKDYFKIKKFGLDNLNYLKVSLEINEREKLINKIKNLCLN